MDIPSPPQAVVALAAFVRERISEVSGTIAPLLGRRDEVEVLPPLGQEPRPNAVLGAARQLATVIVGAAAEFAPTSYSRARLIRQMYASGLLNDDEYRASAVVLDMDPVDDPLGRDGSDGAPR